MAKKVATQSEEGAAAPSKSVADIYAEHNDATAQQGPATLQCQCADCKAHRGEN